LLVTLFYLNRALPRVANPGLKKGVRILGVVGQLAFPLVLLDFLARDVGNIADLFGLPVLRFVIPITLFGAGAWLMGRKTFGLYYGVSPSLRRDHGSVEVQAPSG
jgi:hypothetical protein